MQIKEWTLPIFVQDLSTAEPHERAAFDEWLKTRRDEFERFNFLGAARLGDEPTDRIVHDLQGYGIGTCLCLDFAFDAARKNKHEPDKTIVRGSDGQFHIIEEFNRHREG